MTVVEFAKNVRQNVNKILNLCKKIGINVSSENDILSEDDLILLECELTEEAKKMNENNSKSKSKDNVDVDYESLAIGSAGLVSLVNDLYLLNNNISGFSISPSLPSASLLDECKSSVSESKTLSSELNTKVNNIKASVSTNNGNISLLFDFYDGKFTDEDGIIDEEAIRNYSKEKKLWVSKKFLTSILGAASYNNTMERFDNLLENGNFYAFNEKGERLKDADGFEIIDNNKMESWLKENGLSDEQIENIISDIESNIEENKQIYFQQKQQYETVINDFNNCLDNGEFYALDEKGERLKDVYGFEIIDNNKMESWLKENGLSDEQIENIISDIESNIEENRQNYIDGFLEQMELTEEDYDYLNEEAQNGGYENGYFGIIDEYQRSSKEYSDYALEYGEFVTSSPLLIKNFLDSMNKLLSESSYVYAIDSDYVLDYSKNMTAYYTYVDSYGNKIKVISKEEIPSDHIASCESVSYFDACGSTEEWKLCEENGWSYNNLVDLDTGVIEEKNAIHEKMINADEKVKFFKEELKKLDINLGQHNLEKNDDYSINKVIDKERLISDVNELFNYDNLMADDSGNSWFSLNLTENNEIVLKLALLHGVLDDVTFKDNGDIYIQQNNTRVLVKSDDTEMSDFVWFVKNMNIGDVNVFESGDFTISSPLGDFDYTKLNQSEIDEKINNIMSNFKSEQSNVGSNYIRGDLSQVNSGSYYAANGINESDIYIASKEDSKYIYAAIKNGSNDFYYDGKNVYYVDMNGKSNIVNSVDNCLKNTFKNESDILKNVSAGKIKPVDINYIDNLTYLYNTGVDSVEINNYIDSIIPSVDQRWVNIKTKIDEIEADKDYFNASLVSVVKAIPEGFKTFSYACNKFVYDSDGNDLILRSRTYSSGDTMRSRVSFNIRLEDYEQMKYKMKENGESVDAIESFNEFHSWDGFFYDVGMSMADNIYTTVVTLPFSYIGFSAGVGLGLALGSFDNSYNDALDRGVNHKKAFFYSSTMAGLEAITEQISFNNLVKVTGVNGLSKLFTGVKILDNINIDEAFKKSIGNEIKSFIVKNVPVDYQKLAYSVSKVGYAIISQSMSEGMEEYVSSSVGRIIDNLINGDKSSYNIRFKELLHSGLSEEQAAQTILLENASEDWMSFLSGATSGGFMSGPTSIFTNSTKSGQYLNSLEMADYTGNYDSVISNLLNWDGTPVEANILSANITVESLFASGKIDLDTKEHLNKIITDFKNNSKINDASITSVVSLESKLKELELYSQMQSRLDSLGVNTTDMTFEDMKVNYSDIYEEIVSNHDADSVNVNTESNVQIDQENVQPENLLALQRAVKKIFKNNSSIQDRSAQLAYLIVQGKYFGDDSNKMALISMLQNLKMEGVDVSFDQEVLTSLIGGIGTIGINQEHLLTLINKSDLTMEDVKKFNNISEEDLKIDDSAKNAKLAQALKNYLDNIINNARRENRIPRNGRLKNEHISNYLNKQNNKKSGKINTETDEMIVEQGSSTSESIFGKYVNDKIIEQFNKISEQERSLIAKLFNKSIEDVNATDFKRFSDITDVIKLISKNVPKGFDLNNQDLLFGVNNDDGSECRELLSRQILKEKSIVDAIKTITVKGNVDKIKGVGLYNIVDAINQYAYQYIEENGITIEEGKLPIEMLASRVSFYENGQVDMLSVLDDTYKSIKTNYSKITDGLAQIAKSCKGTLLGYNKRENGVIAHSIKSENSASRKLYTNWLDELKKNGYRLDYDKPKTDTGEYRLIGINDDNQGKNFTINKDGLICNEDGSLVEVDGKNINVKLDNFIPMDMLRYTITAKSGNYINTVISTIKSLQQDGYKILKTRFSWGGQFYQGINLTLEIDSQVLELQIHTDESFYAKDDATHLFYEIVRNQNLNGSAVQDVANYAQMLIQSQVEIPQNAQKFSFLNDFIKYALSNNKTIPLGKVGEIAGFINALNELVAEGELKKNDADYAQFMDEFINEISEDGEFSLGDFLSEYFEISNKDMMSYISELFHNSKLGDINTNIRNGLNSIFDKYKIDSATKEKYVSNIIEFFKTFKDLRKNYKFDNSFIEGINKILLDNKNFIENLFKNKINLKTDVDVFKKFVGSLKSLYNSSINSISKVKTGISGNFKSFVSALENLVISFDDNNLVENVNESTDNSSEFNAIREELQTLNYKKTSIPSYIKSYLASNVRKYLYKNTSEITGLNEQIMEQGLYHFTESADAIIESGYIKPSGVNASYGNPKSFFFNGIPNVGAFATNLDSIPVKVMAVKVMPTTEVVESSKLRIRYVDDMAISYDGRFNLEGMDVQKVYFGLVIENGELVYKEITQEEYNSYENSDVGKVLTEYVSDKKNVRDIKGNFLTDIANRNKELTLGDGSELFDVDLVENRDVNLNRYIESISKNNFYDNFKTIVSSIVKGKIQKIDTYDILVNLNGVRKKVPNKDVYRSFDKRFSDDVKYERSIQPGFYFRHYNSIGFNNDNVTHRLYINAEYENTFKFLELFANKCEQKGIPFYFKTAFFDFKNITGRNAVVKELSLTRSDSAVIYASDEFIEQYIEICKEIKEEHSELNFYNPPVLTATIDGWLGYGADPGIKGDSFNNLRANILDSVISKGINSFIINFGQQVVYNNKTGNDLLIESLFVYLVNNFEVADRESLYNELLSDRDYYLELLKQGGKTISIGEFNVSSYDVKIQMFNDYLINNDSFYEFISNIFKEVSVQFGVDPDNFAFKLGQIKSIETVSDNSNSETHTNLETDLDVVKNMIINSKVISNFSSLVKSILGDKFTSDIQNLIDDMLNIDDLGDTTDFDLNTYEIDKITSFLKSLNSDNLEMIIFGLYSNGLLNDVIANINDKNLLLDIFSNIHPSEQMKLFELMSYENVEYLSRKLFAYKMDRYDYYCSICQEVGIEIGLDSIIKFLTDKNDAFMKVFEVKFSKLDMKNDTNIKMLQDFIINSDVSFSDIISYDFISSVVNDSDFISKLIYGLDSKKLAQLITNLKIINESDIQIFNKFIANISDENLVGLMNEISDYLGRIYAIANNLDINRLGSILSNSDLDVYLKKEIFSKLSYDKIVTLINNNLIKIDGLDFGNLVFRATAGANSLSSGKLFSLLSSEQKIEQFFENIKSGNRFNSEFTNEELFTALCIFSKQFSDNGFIFNFSSPLVTSFYSNVYNEKFSFSDITNLYNRMGIVSDVRNLFPNGLIQTNALDDPNRANLRSDVISVDELLDLLKKGKYSLIKMDLIRENKNYNIYRAAFNKLYQAIKNNNINSDDISPEMMQLLEKISESYNLDKQKMFDECNRLRNFEPSYNEITSNGVTYFYQADFDQDIVMKSIDRINSILSTMPASLRNSTKEIYLNNFDNVDDPFWKFVYASDKHYSVATGGDGNVYIYQKTLLNGGLDERILFHEFAHNLDRAMDKISNSEKWRAAVETDDKYVSDYARNSFSEDFAESLTDYFTAVYTKEVGAFSKLFPNRIKILDEIFSNQGHNSLDVNSNGELAGDSGLYEKSDVDIDDKTPIQSLSEQQPLNLTMENDKIEQISLIKSKFIDSGLSLKDFFENNSMVKEYNVSLDDFLKSFDYNQRVQLVFGNGNYEYVKSNIYDNLFFVHLITEAGSIDNAIEVLNKFDLELFDRILNDLSFESVFYDIISSTNDKNLLLNIFDGLSFVDCMKFIKYLSYDNLIHVIDNNNVIKFIRRDCSYYVEISSKLGIKDKDSIINFLNNPDVELRKILQLKYSNIDASSIDSIAVLREDLSKLNKPISWFYDISNINKIIDNDHYFKELFGQLKLSKKIDLLLYEDRFDIMSKMFDSMNDNEIIDFLEYVYINIPDVDLNNIFSAFVNLSSQDRISSVLGKLSLYTRDTLLSQFNFKQILYIIKNNIISFDKSDIKLNDKNISFDYLLNLLGDDNNISNLFDMIQKKDSYSSEYTNEEILFGILKILERFNSNNVNIKIRLNNSYLNDFYSSYISNYSDFSIIDFVKTYLIDIENLAVVRQDVFYKLEQVGSNQGNIASAFDVKNLFTIDGVKLSFDLIRQVRNEFPGISIKNAIDFLRRIDVGQLKDGSKGTNGICNYADVANAIFEYFGKDGASEFENRFGFPMYRNGKLNDAQLLCDMFLKISGHQLIQKDGNKYSIDYDKLSNYSNLYNHVGSKYGYKTHYIYKYLMSKGISDISIEQKQLFNYQDLFGKSKVSDFNYRLLVKRINDAISNNKHLSITSGAGLKLIDINGKIKYLSGGHIMTIYGFDADGNLLVDSWGKTYKINLREEIMNSESTELTIDSLSFKKVKLDGHTPIISNNNPVSFNDYMMATDTKMSDEIEYNVNAALDSLLESDTKNSTERKNIISKFVDVVRSYKFLSSDIDDISFDEIDYADDFYDNSDTLYEKIRNVFSSYSSLLNNIFRNKIDLSLDSERFKSFVSSLKNLVSEFNKYRYDISDKMINFINSLKLFNNGYDKYSYIYDDISIEQFNRGIKNFEFRLKNTVILGYEMVEFISDKNNIDKLMNSDGIIFGDYNTQELMFCLVKLFQEYDNNGINIKEHYPYISDIYDMYKSRQNDNLLNIDEDIMNFAKEFDRSKNKNGNVGNRMSPVGMQELSKYTSDDNRYELGYGDNFDDIIVDDIGRIIDGNDRKYGPGDALVRLKEFINPNSRNYRNYNIISSNMGARDILRKYTPQDIAKYLSRFETRQVYRPESEILTDIGRIIDGNDRKYVPGDALIRLKEFINPNSRNYGNYEIISSNMGARDILRKYTPQDIAKYLSRFETSQVYNNRYEYLRREFINKYPKFNWNFEVSLSDYNKLSIDNILYIMLDDRKLSNLLTCIDKDISFANGYSNREILFGVVRVMQELKFARYNLEFNDINVQEFYDLFNSLNLGNTMDDAFKFVDMYILDKPAMICKSKFQFYKHSDGRTGVDQGSIANAFNERNLLTENGRKLVNDMINQVKKKFPDMHDKIVVDFLKRIDVSKTSDGNIGTGGICNYADVANLIFEYFHSLNNGYSEFERIFGFPMYRDGHLNDAQLLLDMFISISGDVLLTKNMYGGYNLNFGKKNYLNLATNIDSDILYRADYIGKYLIEKGIFKNDDVIVQKQLFNSEHLSFSEDGNILEKIKISPKYLNNYLIKKINYAIQNNQHLSIGSDKGLKMVDPDGRIINLYEAHIMTIFGIDENGNLLVDSWGKTYRINLEDAIKSNIKFEIGSISFGKDTISNSKSKSFFDKFSLFVKKRSSDFNSFSSQIFDELDDDLKFDEDDTRIEMDKPKIVDGYTLFSKKFSNSVKQMGEYFGDAGINDLEFGKKINKLFLECKTVSEILNELSGNEKKLFEEFLNTSHGESLSKLSSDEIKSLIVYTSSAYSKINDALRKGDLKGNVFFRINASSEGETISIGDLVRNIDSAMAKAGGLDGDMVLYRGVSLFAFTNQNDTFKRAFESIQDKSDVNELYGVMKNFVGKSFGDLAYMSASPGYNTSYAKRPGFPIVLEILTPDGTPGMYINQISKKYNVENEFLFASNTTLKIVDVKVLDDWGDVNCSEKVIVRCVVESDTDSQLTDGVLEHSDMPLSSPVVSDDIVSQFEGSKFDDIGASLPLSVTSEESSLEEFDDSMFYGDDGVVLVDESFDSVEVSDVDSSSGYTMGEASRLFNKPVSEITVEEFEKYKIVVETANKILEGVPEGFFKDDVERNEFLFGVQGDVPTGSEFSASELRAKLLSGISNGSLIDVIETYTKGKLDSIKVVGFYNIIYAINQFVEASAIVVEDGKLPIKQIAAKDPAYFDGARDLILSVLTADLNQAKDNKERITDVLSEIVSLNNGILEGLDKSLKSEGSAVRKVYNLWLEALENAGYTVEIGKNVIDQNGNIKLIGIKDFNKGQSFVITPDGTILTADLKNYGVDQNGNVVNISFSDFKPKDLLRYTVISDSNSYVDTLLNTIRLLEFNGYEIISSNLSWPGSFYKGVNLTLREKSTSQVFELQFHTENSFYAKNEGTHDLYEIKRNKIFNDGSKSSNVQNVADYAQILVQSNVEVPNGAERLGVINKFVKYVLESGKNIDLTKMNEIIAKVKEISSMYDSKTDAYKDAMKALINSVSIEGEFSFGEFLSKYLEEDGFFVKKNFMFYYENLRENGRINVEKGIQIGQIFKDEIEAGGARNKFWCNNCEFLYKSIFDGSYEDFAEIIASEIAKELGIDCAEYDLASFSGKKGVVTKNFVNENAGEVLISGDVITNEVYNKHIKPLQEICKCYFNMLVQYGIDSDFSNLGNISRLDKLHIVKNIYQWCNAMRINNLLLHAIDINNLNMLSDEFIDIFLLNVNQMFVDLDTMYDSEFNSWMHGVTKSNNLFDLCSVLDIYCRLNGFNIDDSNKLMKSLVDLYIYDIIISQGDRHNQNWGIIVNKLTKQVRFSPLYDNSNMCNLNRSKAIDSILADIKSLDSGKFVGQKGELKAMRIRERLLKSIYHAKSSLKVNPDNVLERHNNIKMMEDYVKISSLENIQHLVEKLDMLSDDKMEQIFSRIELRLGVEIPSKVKMVVSKTISLNIQNFLNV